MMKRIIIAALAVIICSSAVAQGKKNKKTKQQTAPVEKVDTVDMKTFSYLAGRINSQGLMQYLTQKAGIDAKYLPQFVEGFNSGNISGEEKARLTGREIRTQVEGMISNLSKQINDSIDPINREEFLRGFVESLTNVETNISADSAQQIVEKQMKYYHEAKMERKFGPNRRAGEEFLKANAKKDGVQTTASGLQYKVLTTGTGEKPSATSKVKVNYEGRLIDGKVFDSSYERGKPITFGVNQVIKGWTEALQLMPVGSKWELYIPQELAYGDRDQESIPAFSCLIFTVELLEIVK